MNLKAYMEEKRLIIDEFLKHIFLYLHIPSPLKEAIEYMVFSSGKRIRPILTIATYESIKKNSSLDYILPFACAIEMIHTYSLIHDDLPAMDNDDMRRGKPTCHRAFGEAIAILAGDALLTEAFRVMTDKRFVGGIDETLRTKAIFEIAKASGSEGMVGGQSLDIIYDGKRGSKRIVKKIHLLKTASLIKASTVVGAILAEAKRSVLVAVSKYGKYIGFAFQIRDDLLDFEGKEEIVGKRLKKDITKQTFPKYYGTEDAEKKLEILIEEAKRAIEKLPIEKSILYEIAELIKERER